MAEPITEIKESQPATVFVRRNYVLGILNGTLVQLGLSVVHPNLVLSAFVYESTKSAFLVGLLATLAPLGLLWPQLHVSSLIEHRPHKKPFYVVSFFVRVVVLVGLVGAIWLTTHPGLTVIALVLFFVCFFAWRTAQGVGMTPFFDIVGQTIQPTRLGAFFAYRTFFASVLVLLAGGLVVQPVLESIPSPHNYALLAALGTFIMALGWGVFIFAHEAGNDNPPARRSFREVLLFGLRMVRDDSNYRLFVLRNILLRFNVLALAFYVPYGVEKFQATKMGGAFIAMFTLGRLLSSRIWGQISDKSGNRACLMSSSAFFVLSPVAVLVSPRLPEVFRWEVEFLPSALDLPLLCYMTAVLFFGMALEGHKVGMNSFLLESAPADRRPSYIGFLNTVRIPFTLLPLLAGLFLRTTAGELDVLHAEVMFGLIVASGLLVTYLAWRLKEIRWGPGTA